METPDPPNDTPGALKQVVLTPHDIPWSLMYYALGPSPQAWKSDKIINIFRLVLDSLWISSLGILTGIVAGSNVYLSRFQRNNMNHFLQLPKQIANISSQGKGQDRKSTSRFQFVPREVDLYVWK